MWEPKSHKMIARQSFDRGDGVSISKGQEFEVVVTSFHRDNLELFALHFDSEKPTIIPCAFAAFANCKETREAE